MQIILNEIALEDLLNEFRAIVKDEVLNLTPPPTPNGKPYLSAKEAAGILNIILQTLHQNLDKIPHRKLHGKLYFKRSQLHRAERRSGAMKKSKPSAHRETKLSKCLKNIFWKTLIRIISHLLSHSCATQLLRQTVEIVLRSILMFKEWLV